MEIYNGTGVLKTEELRVTKGIGGLLVTTDNKVLSALTNETITIWIERANEKDIYLFNKTNLRRFILGTTNGMTMVKEALGLSALCDITNGGAIPLKPQESVKIKMEGLIAGTTYSLNGIEYPLDARNVIIGETKIVLADEIRRSFNVEDYDTMVCSNFDLVDSVNVTFNNGSRIEYTPKEFKALAFDIEPVIGVNTLVAVPSNVIAQANDIIFPLTMTDEDTEESVDIVDIEFEKQNGKMEITFVAL